jgi:hypothetical protein
MLNFSSFNPETEHIISVPLMLHLHAMVCDLHVYNTDKTGVVRNELGVSGKNGPSQNGPTQNGLMPKRSHAKTVSNISILLARVRDRGRAQIGVRVGLGL